MIFGSISYLNLLPFQVYMKRYSPSSQFSQMLRWRQNVPSVINRDFHMGKIHTAFISSIKSQRCKCTDLGIVADGAVKSVFVIEGKNQKDPASDTSNILAKVLGIEGGVLIGDKALKYYLSGGKGIDLAKEWKEQTDLPFVFARLCYRDRGKRIKQFTKNFGIKEQKIPQYILKKEAKKRGITSKQLNCYLEHISYHINWKEQKSLKLFFKKAKKLKGA